VKESRRLDLLDRRRSSVKKSPTESVLVDLDLFCVRVLDPSWTRFSTTEGAPPAEATWTAETDPAHLGPSKRSC